MELLLDIIKPIQPFLAGGIGGGISVRIQSRITLFLGTKARVARALGSQTDECVGQWRDGSICFKTGQLPRSVFDLFTVF